ncbi:hypothetical protein NC653_026359 [Populus alba x Populus x berolinensis]|uniref:Uncharacterized protein n=1 Tax=Populus alba x Populus x berolinensis TaxID=444605 RepID=A0AAD6MDU6_9ROSI|nr:hypothetical protein NC653_026359 [Populus alba x Populus x berolinensis]
MRIFIFQRRKSSPSNEELVTLCSEFLNGGTDTTVDEKDVEKTRSIYMQMVQEFAYPPYSKLDISVKLGFTVVMKNSLRALVKPRA